MWRKYCSRCYRRPSKHIALLPTSKRDGPCYELDARLRWLLLPFPKSSSPNIFQKHGFPMVPNWTRVLILINATYTPLTTWTFCCQLFASTPFQFFSGPRLAELSHSSVANRKWMKSVAGGRRRDTNSLLLCSLEGNSTAATLCPGPLLFFSTPCILLWKEGNLESSVANSGRAWE